MAQSLQFTEFNQANLTHTKTKPSVPLVLIHGWGLNSAVWQPLLTQLPAEFTDNFQVITIDLPGFGLNNQLTISPYHLSVICQQIAQVIKQPAIYLGWSLGGLVATEMALHFPHQVLGLITVASSPCFVEQAATGNNQLSWPGINTKVLDNFHQQLSQDTAKTISSFLKVQAMGSPHIRQDLKKITQLVIDQPLPTQATLAHSLDLLANTDLREQLASIKVPFLRLYGHNDSLVPKRVCNQVSALATQSSQHIFPKASHAPFISHLNDFTHVLTHWLLDNFWVYSRKDGDLSGLNFIRDKGD